MSGLEDNDGYVPRPTGALRTQLNDGRYLLFGMLGVGGMATVYRCWDTELQVWRAAKVLLADLRTRKGVRERFKTEARAMAAIDHPNVARVLDVGEDAGVPFIVLEMLDGGSLETWLAENGPMDEALAIHAMIEVCEGVQAAHRAGLIHRDIKPDNLMVDRHGRCKVTDFGIAGGAAGSQTRTGVAMGTLDYMAPEQRQDAKNVTQAADIYALGCTLFALLTDATPANLFVASTDPHRLDAAPASLKEVIAKATMYDPTERYADCGELKAALRRVQAELDDPAVDALRLVCEQEPLPDPDTHVSFSASQVPDVAGPTSLPGTMSGPTIHLPQEGGEPTLLQDEAPPAEAPAVSPSASGGNRGALIMVGVGVVLFLLGGAATGFAALAISQRSSAPVEAQIPVRVDPPVQPVEEPVPPQDAPDDDATQTDDAPPEEATDDEAEDAVEPPAPAPVVATPAPERPAPVAPVVAPVAPRPVAQPVPAPPPEPAPDAPRVGSAMVVVRDGTGLVVTCGDTVARGTASARLRNFPAGTCQVDVSWLGKPYRTRVTIDSRREVHCSVDGETLACR